MEMNSIPWSPVLRYTTPLPMNGTPVSTVALQHKSVSSALRYVTPLLINRTPVSTVGGPFPPFCGTPYPYRSTGPCFPVGGPTQVCFLYFAVRQTPDDEHDPVSNVVGRTQGCFLLRYASPCFHRLFCPSPPDEHDDAFRSDPAGWFPMNTTTTLFLCSDPAMYTSPSRTYARVGVRDPTRMYVRGRIYFLAPWLYVCVHGLD